MKKDIYICLLELGKKSGIEGVTINDVYTHMHKNGFFDADEYKLLKDGGAETKALTDKRKRLSHLYEEAFPQGSAGKKRTMTIEGAFRLIEYQELVEARENAKSAKTFSLIAIGISVLALLASAYFSYLQMTTPLELGSASLTELVEIIQANAVQDPSTPKMAP